MSSALSNDLWQLILSLLDERYIYKLRCSGDKGVLQSISKMKSAVYYSIKPPSSWPSRVTKDSPLDELSIGIADHLRETRFIPLKKSMVLSKFPRNLRTLWLAVVTDDSPFGVHDLSFYNSFKQAIDLHFPHLTKLALFGLQAQFWALPSSVTDLTMSGAPIAEHLPRHLRRLKCNGGYGGLCGSLNLPKTLEWVEISQHGNIGKMPPLPSLAHYSGDYLHEGSTKPLAERFPCLTSLRLRGAPLKSIDWIPASIRVLHLPSLPPHLTSSLPPHLTLWTQGDREKPQVPTIYAKDLHALPRYLSKIIVSPQIHPSFITASWMDHLPKHLVFLDIRWYIVTPEQMASFPTTLTSLHVHNVRGKSIAHLQNLNSLALYGGLLTAQVLKALPRGLQSLTLTEVALRTKGHYQRPGETEHRRYSTKDPQWSTLKHLPRSLTKFVITPLKSHSYFLEDLSILLNLLPVQLQVLGLKFKGSTFVSELSSHSNAADSSVADVPSSQSLDLLRFRHLEHLYFGVQVLGKSPPLPPSLTALYMFFIPDPLDSLPNLKYLGGHYYSSQARSSLSMQSYSNYEHHLDDTPNYDGLDDFDDY